MLDRKKDFQLGLTVPKCRAEGNIPFATNCWLTFSLNCNISFQPVLCEGPIDSWLPNLISSLKQTLLDQLTSVLSPAQPERGATPHGEGVAAPEEPPRTAGSMGRVEKSFTLDNCSEVVLLATQIELCKKIDKSLKQVCTLLITYPEICE